MTSSNENIFRVTGPLWGESTGHWLKFQPSYSGTNFALGYRLGKLLGHLHRLQAETSNKNGYPVLILQTINSMRVLWVSQYNWCEITILTTSYSSFTIPGSIGDVNMATIEFRWYNNIFEYLILALNRETGSNR